MGKKGGVLLKLNVYKKHYLSTSILENHINDTKAGVNEMYSFSDWCLDNERQEYLDRWDYEKNELQPNKFTYRSNMHVYLKCPRNIHLSEKYSILLLTSRDQGKCRACNSFAQYCIDNDLYFYKYWDYVKNENSPFEVAAFSSKKFWFLCPDGIHESELHTISHLTSKFKFNCKECHSLSRKLSAINTMNSNIDDYDYRKKYKNKGFPRRVDREKSFAKYNMDLLGSTFIDKYWSDMNNVDPWEISPKSHAFVFIQCQNNEKHIYNICASSFSIGIRCPFCSGLKVMPEESLAADFPEVSDIWSEKNELLPYEVSKSSGKKYWFKCHNGIHDDYSKTISNAKSGHWLCPKCVRHSKKSFLHKAVENYITDELHLDILTENNCSLLPRNPKNNRPLYYDIEVVKHRLIIEVNGQQHYDAHAYKTIWKKDGITPEEQFNYRTMLDKYKKIYALENGYNYLEIPYWSENNFKEIINDKIRSIA